MFFRSSFFLLFISDPLSHTRHFSFSGPKTKFSQRKSLLLNGGRTDNGMENVKGVAFAHFLFCKSTVCKVRERESGQLIDGSCIRKDITRRSSSECGRVCANGWWCSDGLLGGRGLNISDSQDAAHSHIVKSVRDMEGTKFTRTLQRLTNGLKCMSVRTSSILTFNK